MQKKRLGVIGVGYLGKFHAQKYAQMETADLVAVVDADLETAKKIAEENGAEAYTDYKDMIDKVDAVSIATPTSYHYEVAKDFINAGKDLMIEKPITVTVEEADELVELADKKGVIIQVGHLEQFNPAMVAARAHIDNPRFIESHRLSFFKGRGADVSVVLDLMIHDIEIILSLVGSGVKNISASGATIITDNIDLASARIDFENGCAANVTVSRVSKDQMRKIRFFQHDKFISLDFGEQIVGILKKSDRVVDGIPQIDEEQVQVEKSDALYEELASFVDCVIERKEPLVTGKAGRDALKVAHDVIDHIKSTLNP